MQITIRELMSVHPVTVCESTTLAEATRLVIERAIDELYVCDQDDRLLGAVADYELLKARLMRIENEQPVASILSRQLLTLRPEMKLDDIAPVFRDGCHSRAAIVENGRIVGQLNRRDVLRALVLVDRLDACGATRRPDSASATTSRVIRRLERDDHQMPPESASARSESFRPRPVQTTFDRHTN